MYQVIIDVLVCGGFGEYSGTFLIKETEDEKKARSTFKRLKKRFDTKDFDENSDYLCRKLGINKNQHGCQLMDLQLLKDDEIIEHI